MTDSISGYSVLMSVYHKEKADYLREAMESIWNQTVPTDNFVLVCDGPLGEALQQTIAQMKEKFGQRLCVVALETNMGLGKALEAGLKHCRHELVARMDSDDISCPDRCERQLSVFRSCPEVGLVSGTVMEFYGSTDNILGQRALPQSHAEIVRFSRKRNPFNHPAVMFRKSQVETAGGYIEKYHLFEDYYLWVRMLQNGCVGYNIPENVLYMRTSPDLYQRRGGKAYAMDMLRFHQWLHSTKWSTMRDYITGALPHALICVLPNSMRGAVYKLLHR